MECTNRITHRSVTSFIADIILQCTQWLLSGHKKRRKATVHVSVLIYECISIESKKLCVTSFSMNYIPLSPCVEYSLHLTKILILK